MFLKDLRLFRRDPVQWSQFLILFALLGLYSLNVHPFQSPRYAGWVSMVSFMNLCVVGLLMATFTTRFVFPMISLEAGLWLLGLLPIRRDTSCGAIPVLAGLSLGALRLLVLLSDSRLGVPRGSRQSTKELCILVLGLSGIAVGWGPGCRTSASRRPRGSPPASAARSTWSWARFTSWQWSGSWHCPATSRVLPNLPGWRHFAPCKPGCGSGSVGGTLGSVLLGVAATALPLRIGLRAFRRLEY